MNVNTTALADEIVKLAKEELKTPEELQAFADGFDKAASFSDISKYLTNTSARDGGASILAKAGVGLAGALIGAGVVKGINSISNGVTNLQLRNKFETALAQVMSGNRIVRGYSPDKSKAYAETIFKFAPNVASDPNLLGSILANIVQGEGVDPMTIKTLVDLEGRYKDNNSTSPIPGFKLG
jgi:hypothetical protein